MNGVHDLGGQHGHGQIVVEDDEPVFHHAWEGRVYAMMRLATKVGVFTTDEFRSAVEKIEPSDYLRSSYFERWLTAIERLTTEKGVQDLDGTLPVPVQTERPPLTPRFSIGARVRARNLHPRHHTRAPRYVRGHMGVITHVYGPYLFPDQRARDGDDRWEPVYSVGFSASELWGTTGEAEDLVSVDLWESYLERV